MGFPTFEEQGKNLLSFEEYLIENIHASFLTKMQSNNLTSAGILKGDMIVLERRIKVNAGEIVLVMLDDHHVFLKAEMEKGQMRLRSFIDNALYTNEVEIIGVIKGLIRKY